MKYANNEEMKLLILEASEIVFGKKGYENTNLQDIADEMKISRGPIYYYFKNKETLYLETLKYHFGKEYHTYYDLLSQDISLWEMIKLKLKFASRCKQSEAAGTFTDTRFGLTEDMILCIRNYYEQIYQLEQDRIGKKLKELNIVQQEEIDRFIKLLIIVYEGTESLATRKELLIDNDDAEKISDFLIDLFQKYYQKESQ